MSEPNVGAGHPAPSSFTSAHPGWFGAVMASAVLANVLASEGSLIDALWLRPAAGGVLVIASLLSLVLLVPYLRRLRPGGVLVVELGDPARGPLLATFPAGLLLLATAWGYVGPLMVPASVATAVCAVLACAGVLIGLVFSIAWSTSALRGSQGIAAINGGWVIPPMGVALVGLAVSPLIPAWPEYSRTLLIIAVMFLGAGMTLSLIMITLVVLRLVLHPGLPAPLAPTMWIPIAPAAVLGIATLRLCSDAVSVGLVDGSAMLFAGVIDALTLGFGLWWALFAAWDLRRLRRLGPIPFQPGWFAFLFPPTALALAFIGAVQAFDAVHLVWLTVVVVAALFAFWAYVVIRSIPLLPATIRS